MSDSKTHKPKPQEHKNVLGIFLPVWHEDYKIVKGVLHTTIGGMSTPHGGLYWAPCRQKRTQVAWIHVCRPFE